MTHKISTLEVNPQVWRKHSPQTLAQGSPTGALWWVEGVDGWPFTVHTVSKTARLTLPRLDTCSHITPLSLEVLI